MGKNKGITLIALVITIIILLILAGVAISSLTENGLFEKARLAKEKQTEAEVKEKINLLVSEYAIDREQGKTLSEFLAEKKDNGEIDDFTDNGDGTFDVIINGYVITINENDLSTTEPVISSDIIVTYSAKTFTDNKIQVVITTKSQSAGIKEIRLLNGVTVQGNNKNSVAFDHIIEANTEYQIEVELVDGTTSTKTIKYEDTEAPTATIEITNKVIFKGGKIQAKIYIEDNRSGVNIEACKWVAVQESENLGTEDESLYTETFTNVAQTIGTESITEAGEYYIHLLLKDNVGNITEIVSEKVEIKDGYAISTPDDLQAIGTNYGDDIYGDYYITQNIDMKGYEFSTIKKQFKGTIDGQGYTIYNLNINKTSDGLGIFNTINNATFKNIVFENVDIDSEYSEIGVIAGSTSYNISYFYNVGITGKIKGGTRVGSFIGVANGGGAKFENCYARTEITTTKSNSSAAGFIGYRLTASMYVDKCYFSGNISDTATARGAILPTGGTSGRSMTDGYYNSDLFTTETSYMYSGTALTTEQFANAENFDGWDFKESDEDTDYTWYIDEETGYPELKF